MIAQDLEIFYPFRGAGRVTSQESTWVGLHYNSVTVTSSAVLSTNLASQADMDPLTSEEVGDILAASEEIRSGRTTLFPRELSKEDFWKKFMDESLE